MAVHGQLYPFDSTMEEDWANFLECVEIYFAANGIIDNNQKQGIILLSSCVLKTFTLITCVVTPSKPVDIPYGDLESLIRSHYNPKPKQAVSTPLLVQLRMRSQWRPT